ncbi:hypothetical protein BV898_14319 [Hypsibius exemplaris]|uniref:TATA box-binding protein-associated factor RNA polymerase I subunit B n=1 Tax=Hypsibius exemplaris TaxID=2072580 RepID=A0A9X6N8P1_HYPEX|nr:hypothetical protein BV898_14319 [Hypsibius exemplaris]
MPSCQQCGLEKFYEADGYFYCEICHIQSQDLLRTVNESEFTSQVAFNIRANAFRIGPTQSQREEDGAGDLVAGAASGRTHGSLFTPGKPESLFLLADVVLRAQVEWLVQNAGARKQLSDVVKNVWFSYLAKAVPDLSQGLSGDSGPLRKGNTWVKTLREVDISAMGNCRYKDLKRLMDYWESLTRPPDECDDENVSPEGIENQEDVSKSNFKRRRSASEPRKTASSKPFSRVTEPSKLSLGRMIAILVISLHLCEDVILISDILRWIRNLNLPCWDPSSVLPDDQFPTFFLLGSLKDLLAIHYHEIEWDMEVMLKYLQVPSASLPSLSVLPVIARFVEELNLPRDLIVMVHDIAESIGIRWHLDINAGKRDWSRMRPQNVEATVMSLIIHTLIVLFGLNDSSERKITTQSHHIERLTNHTAHLFDWYDWMEHINQRRHYLFQHTTLLEHHSVPAALGFIRIHFVRNDRRRIPWSRLKKNKYQDENYEDLQRAFQEVNFHHPPPEFFLSLPVTQRPFRAHTQGLVHLYPELSKDFSEDSLAHVTVGLEDHPSADLQRCLTAIRLIQKQARTEATPIGASMLRLRLRKMLSLEHVPSHVLQWLIPVCAEMIEQRPAALLGRLVHLEEILFSNKVK